jgi:hypothetical protein
MPDPEVVIIPIVFALPTFAIVVRMVLKHREKMAELNRGAPPPAALEERLARVENSVDAIAIEMERVGEGQRFLVKVLSDRNQLPAGAPSSSPPKTTTPH